MLIWHSVEPGFYSKVNISYLAPYFASEFNEYQLAHAEPTSIVRSSLALQGSKAETMHNNSTKISINMIIIFINWSDNLQRLAKHQTTD